MTVLFLLLAGCFLFPHEEQDAEPQDTDAYEAPADTGDNFSWDDPQDEDADQVPDDTDTEVSVVDQDSDGHSAESDCDDTNASVYPGSDEVCNGYDDDCDEQIDEAGADGENTWYADQDGDTFGDAASSTTACDQPEGSVEVSTDCDDTDAGVNPDGTEVNDGADNDCDGVVDGVPDYCCRDADGDGWGDPDDCQYEETGVCEEGFVWGDGDCDDTNPTVNPDREDSEFDPNDADCSGA